LPRSRKSNIIKIMMKMNRILVLSALCLTGTLYASLANDLRKDIVSETPLVRRRAVYSVIHSTLSPVTAINLLAVAATDNDLLVRRLAVSGIAQFSAFFDETDIVIAPELRVSTAAFSDELAEDATAQQKINLTSIALDILKNALSDSAAVIRADAVRVLGAFPPAIAGGEVLAMLDDSSFIVVKEALRAAANLQLTGAAEKVDKLLKHKGEIIRISAAEFAGDMRLEEYFKHLQRMASKDQSADARKTALRAMIKIRPLESAAILKEYLGEKDTLMALEAAFLLARDSDDSGKKIVLPSLNSKDAAIRLAAAKVLLYYDDEESRELFRSLLNDTDAEVRSFAERHNRREE